MVFTTNLCIKALVNACIHYTIWFDEVRLWKMNKYSKISPNPGKNAAISSGLGAGR